MLQVKKTNMKDAFDRLVSIQNIAKERIWAREYINRILKNEKRTKTEKKKNIQELRDNYKSYNIHVMGIPEERQRTNKMTTKHFP